MREVCNVLREQKPPLPGMRPALLSEVAGTLGRSVVPACPFGGAHDDATVSCLLSQTLLAEQEAKELEELEAKLADREHRLLMSCSELCGRFDLRDQFTRLETQLIGWAGIKWEIEKRKGKKRRKRKLPKTSPSRLLPRCALPRQGCRRPCVLQRRVPAVHDVREPGSSSDSVSLQTLDVPVATQRQVPTVHTLQVLFFEVIDMPVEVLAALVVDFGSGMFMAGFAGNDALRAFIVGFDCDFAVRAVFPSVPRCSASRPV